MREDDNLRDFPAYTLYPDRILYRIHQEIHDPLYFSSAGDGRFDLPPETDHGTCYMAVNRLGAFAEVFGRFGYINQLVLDERMLTTAVPNRPMRLADFTDRSVLGKFGISGDLSTGPPSQYDESQRWARRLWEAGFDGIFYVARYDPSFQERSVAAFGTNEQEEKIFEIATAAIPLDLVREAVDQFQFAVLPATEIWAP